MRRFLPTLLLLATVFGADASMPAMQRVSADSVTSAARSALEAKLGSDAQGATLTVIGAPEDIEAPEGKVSLKVHAVNGRWPRPRVGVAVDVSVNERVLRTATVWFALSVNRSALVYASDMTVGTLAKNVKLVPHDTDVASIQGEAITEPDDMDGYRLRHAVVADAIAVRTDFERIPDVDRQQHVDVVATVGSVSLRTRGVASKQGASGDVIPVLVDGADSPVLARIIDKGAVEVVH
jgi:flagellar basal body P-ring formation protein FlgA